MECASRSCEDALSLEKDAYVRVRFNVDETWSNTMDQWPIDIDPGGNGLGMFHRACWDRLFTEYGVRRGGRGRGGGRGGRSNRGRRHESDGMRPFSSRLREANKTAEYFSSRVIMTEQAENVATLLENSHHAIFFTGAGISTSAGIGDFRGPFGVWTERERLRGGGGDSSQTNDPEHDEDDVPYEDLRPTLAHEAIAWLVKEGLAKYVITQNCDGLHRLSGVDKDLLSELHGSVFTEYCRNCLAEHERPYYVCNDDVDPFFEELHNADERKGSKNNNRKKKDRPALPPHCEICPRCRFNHRTIRSCANCESPLYDTLIHFGDWLRDSEMGPASHHAERADLIVALGSTITVTPASDLCDVRRKQPQQQKQRRRTTSSSKTDDNAAAAAGDRCDLVICNRQRTAKDSDASVRVFGDCDVFMALVLKKIMGTDAFDEWRKGRPMRLDDYASARKPPTSN